MDSKYKSLVTQIGAALEQLHDCYEEIGLASYERQEREQQVFAALSATIQEQIELTNGEKNDLISECEAIINEIEKLERSLSNESPKQKRRLKITCPLIQCRDSLKEKEAAIAKMHEERYGQIKKLVHAMQAYSEHLESGFIRVQLPPITNDATQVRSFNLSEPYFNKLDDEFTRVYQEYTRRVTQVQQVCTEIVQLWAELGTPSIQTEQAIVECYRDEPEKLGLREEDIRRLKQKREKLINEKEDRERRIEELTENITLLWNKLSIPESDRKSFLANHRGVGLKCIQEMETEHERLMELKHQNLHIFVEDARAQLQELWDRLLFSEDEILAFQPAFSEVYTDALLSAHEAEISRLEKLVEERMPILSLIDRYRSLLDDKEQLAASANDASRLVSRSATNRDPGRLLREEKMRKRITRDLPKIEAELTRVLEDYEDEHGTPFLVHGENYLDVIEDNSTTVRPARASSNATSTSSPTTSGPSSPTPPSSPNTSPPSSSSSPPLSQSTWTRSGP
ncbi:hypothetical protein BJ508DRAFT_210838 [Ascobolus immersus RN42]|uniref:Microtubule associated protein n=1 Tax=Ascobolus immersus RN42 TaxID=1160509 RepID=A0A3N4I0X6_ASCIM|nr:hypothetical protein BJ508DRAFT_210838 [Ascobolus immersus RN42]